MWFDGVRQPDTIYAAAVSRGKDSTAMLRAIQILEFPLDVIYSTDIWFDDDTPAELPPMVEFKSEWDKKCEEKFGLPVTRLCATTTKDKKYSHKDSETSDKQNERVKLTYCDIFYRNVSPEREREREVCSMDGTGMETNRFTDSRFASEAGARITSKQTLRIPKSESALVYRGAQAKAYYGFPMRGGRGARH